MTILHTKTIGAILVILSCCSTSQASKLEGPITDSVEAAKQLATSHQVGLGDSDIPHNTLGLPTDPLISKTNPSRSQSLPLNGQKNSSPDPSELGWAGSHLQPLDLGTPPESPSPKKNRKSRGRSRSAGTIIDRASRRRGSFKPGLPSMEEVDEDGKAHEASRTDSPVRGPANIEKDIPSSLTEVHALESFPPLGETDTANHRYQDLTALNAVPAKGAALMHKSSSMPEVGLLAEIEPKPKQRPLLHLSTKNADDKTRAALKPTLPSHEENQYSSGLSLEQTTQGKSLPTGSSIQSHKEVDLTHTPNASSGKDHSLRVEDDKTEMAPPSSGTSRPSEQPPSVLNPQDPETKDGLHQSEASRQLSSSVPPAKPAEKPLAAPGSQIFSSGGQSDLEAKHDALPAHQAESAHTAESPHTVPKEHLKLTPKITADVDLPDVIRKTSPLMPAEAEAPAHGPRTVAEPSSVVVAPATDPFHSDESHSVESERDDSLSPETTSSDHSKPNSPEPLTGQRDHSPHPASVGTELSNNLNTPEKLRVEIPDRSPPRPAATTELPNHDSQPPEHPELPDWGLVLDSDSDNEYLPSSTPSSPRSPTSPGPFESQNDGTKHHSFGLNVAEALTKQHDHPPAPPITTAEVSKQHSHPPELMELPDWGLMFDSDSDTEDFHGSIVNSPRSPATSPGPSESENDIRKQNPFGPNPAEPLTKQHDHLPAPPVATAEAPNQPPHSPGQLKLEIPSWSGYDSDSEYHIPVTNPTTPQTPTSPGSFESKDEITNHNPSSPNSPDYPTRPSDPSLHLPVATAEMSNEHSHSPEKLKVGIPSRSMSLDSDSDFEYHLPGPKPMSPRTPTSPDSFEFEDDPSKSKIPPVPSALHILEWLEHKLPHIQTTENEYKKILSIDDPILKPSPVSPQKISVEEPAQMAEDQRVHSATVPSKQLESAITSTHQSEPVAPKQPEKVSDTINELESGHITQHEKVSPSTKDLDSDIKKSPQLNHRFSLFNMMSRASGQLKKRWYFFTNLLDKLSGRKSRIHAEPPSQADLHSPFERSHSSHSLTVQNTPLPSYPEAIHTIDNDKQWSKKVWGVLEKTPSGDPTSSKSFTPPMEAVGGSSRLMRGYVPNEIEEMRWRKRPKPSSKLLPIRRPNPHPRVRPRSKYFGTFRFSQLFDRKTQQQFARIPPRIRSLARNIHRIFSQSKRLLTKLYRFLRNPFPSSSPNSQL
ncbi:hypothetical protein PGT21_033076 [Puccinia graminis f. sp. tritici]|uniref:Uncharacterized protein n=2 Tax=Puccinia graminis f. sp. tritici TaxID=56615 RepID=A0A5B0NG34_PUCGR|nr:hypothetical protein PGT21_033076 [Puccinia graminis f. sp. tritici]